MTFLALLFFAQDYNAQALEYVRQARDTANPVYHAKAEEALRKSFEAAPDNFEGLKAKTWLLLGQHRFAEALESREAQQKSPKISRSTGSSWTPTLSWATMPKRRRRRNGCWT